MFEKLQDRLLAKLEKKIKEWMCDAFNEGYVHGYTDASRRMEFMYRCGVDKGIGDGLDYAGAIFIEDLKETEVLKS